MTQKTGGYKPKGFSSGVKPGKQSREKPQGEKALKNWIKKYKLKKWTPGLSAIVFNFANIGIVGTATSRGVREISSAFVQKVIFPSLKTGNFTALQINLKALYKSLNKLVFHGRSTQYNCSPKEKIEEVRTGDIFISRKTDWDETVICLSEKSNISKKESLFAGYGANSFDSVLMSIFMKDNGSIELVFKDNALAGKKQGNYVKFVLHPKGDGRDYMFIYTKKGDNTRIVYVDERICQEDVSGERLTVGEVGAEIKGMMG